MIPYVAAFNWQLISTEMYLFSMFFACRTTSFAELGLAQCTENKVKILGGYLMLKKTASKYFILRWARLIFRRRRWLAKVCIHFYTLKLDDGVPLNSLTVLF